MAARQSATKPDATTRKMFNEFEISRVDLAMARWMALDPERNTEDYLKGASDDVRQAWNSIVQDLVADKLLCRDK